MPLNEQRRQQLDSIVLEMANKNAPESDVKMIVNDFITKYANEQPVEKQETFSDKIKQSAEKRGGDIVSAFKANPEMKTTGQNPVESAVQVVGSGAGFVGDVIYEGLNKVSGGLLEKGMSKIGETSTAQKLATSINEWSQKNPRAAADLGGIINIASLAPAFKGGQVAGKTALKGTGEALKVGGAITEKGGKKLMSTILTPTESQAQKLLSYRAKTPVLERVSQAAKGIEKAPVTVAEVANKYNLVGLTRQGIGVKAKRLANNLWEKEVNPALNSIKEKVSKDTILKSVQSDINAVKDLSKKKALQEAFNSLKNDYKNVNSWNVKTLDKIKSEMAESLPQKVWKGQDISSSFQKVRKSFSEKAREEVRKKLPSNVKDIYDEYGSLKELQTRGSKALQQGLRQGVLGITGEVIQTALTPAVTLSGLGISKAGKAIRTLGGKIIRK